MKKIILIYIFLNISVFAEYHFNLECKNSMTNTSSILVEFLDRNHGKITLKGAVTFDSKYFEVLSESREEVTLKTDEGSLLVLEQTVRGILLKNLSESFSISYRSALCSQ